MQVSRQISISGPKESLHAVATAIAKALNDSGERADLIHQPGDTRWNIVFQSKGLLLQFDDSEQLVVYPEPVADSTAVTKWNKMLDDFYTQYVLPAVENSDACPSISSGKATLGDFFSAATAGLFEDAMKLRGQGGDSWHYRWKDFMAQAIEEKDGQYTSEIGLSFAEHGFSQEEITEYLGEFNTWHDAINHYRRRSQK